MKKRFYEAFTLVEMLIVMGILIILMVIGITAGRFAINRANDVAHQNAADQIYQGLQAYYTDNRVFPPEQLISNLVGNPGACTQEQNLLCDYMDSGSFKGGTEATYHYFVDDDANGQSVLVCVTLGGLGDARHRGIYCTGNGFGDANLSIGVSESASNLTSKDIPYDEENSIYSTISGVDGADWNGNSWDSTTTP